ncbi:hypothetical protein NMY22_g2987 [Coprinellus aureogranulatus]|nr:hypothetical protein NMY22_g2987 [Coprinellus aureogranulatus]
MATSLVPESLPPSLTPAGFMTQNGASGTAQSSAQADCASERAGSPATPDISESDTPCPADPLPPLPTYEEARTATLNSGLHRRPGERWLTFAWIDVRQMSDRIASAVLILPRTLVQSSDPVLPPFGPPGMRPVPSTTHRPLEGPRESNQAQEPSALSGSSANGLDCLPKWTDLRAAIGDFEAASANIRRFAKAMYDEGNKLRDAKERIADVQAYWGQPEVGLHAFARNLTPLLELGKHPVHSLISKDRTD